MMFRFIKAMTSEMPDYIIEFCPFLQHFGRYLQPKKTSEKLTFRMSKLWNNWR